LVRDLELAVVGAILIDPSCLDEIRSECTWEDFENQRARVIYRAILHLHDEGVAVDLVTLGELLQRHDQLDRVGGAIGLSQITDAVVTTAHARSYARQIARRAGEGRIRRAAREISTSPCSDVYSFAGRALEQISAACAITGTEQSELIGECAWRFLRRQESGDGPQPLDTGISDEHGHEVRLHPELSILGAHAGDGKSTFALSLLLEIGIKRMIPCLYISTEDSKDTISARALSNLAGVPLHRVRDGTYAESDVEGLRTAAVDLAKGRLRVEHKPGLEAARLPLVMRQAIHRHGARLIVVDYLARLRPSAGSMNDFGVAQEVTRLIADAAQELQVPTLVLHHPKKPQGGRTELTMHDLRHAGVDEARQIWLLSRDSHDEPRGDNMSLVVAKNNNGPRGRARLSYDLRYARVEMGGFDDGY
jgi:replicative DNA helicase